MSFVEKHRLFLGVRIPHLDQYQIVLRNLVYDLDVKVSIVNPTKYHFTLHFFGDTTDNEIEKIDIILKNIEYNAFNVILKGLGTFPHGQPKKTRVLFVDVLDIENNLISLVNIVRTELSKEGFNVEKRPYHPHLTIGRVKRGRDIEKLHKMWFDQEFKEIEIEANSYHLIKSSFSNKNAIYTNIKEYHLN